MWKNKVPPDRPQVTKHYGAENMGLACRLTKARYTHTLLMLIFIIVNGSTQYFVARQQCRGNTFLHFHGNTEHFLLLTATILATRIKRERNVALLCNVRSPTEACSLHLPTCVYLCLSPYRRATSSVSLHFNILQAQFGIYLRLS